MMQEILSKTRGPRWQLMAKVVYPPLAIAMYMMAAYRIWLAAAITAAGGDAPDPFDSTVVGAAACLLAGTILLAAWVQTVSRSHWEGFRDE